MKLATADEMRRIDAAGMQKYGIPGAVLMENAGRQVAEAVRGLLDAFPGARVVIFCGKGNNGGDGFVAARHLSNQGADVHCVLLADPSALTGDAAANFRIAHTMGVPIEENADDSAVRVRADRADIIVDAILGTGASGEVHGVARTAIEAINASDAPVVAADIPSGIHADTGAILGAAVRADVTVTFGIPRLGLVQYPGREHCGELRVVDISLPRHLLTSDSLKANLVTSELAESFLPPRFAAMHKGDAGRVLVVAGSVGMTGAAALCSIAAVRAGAGLVTLACPASLNDILEAKCTEAMTLPVAETGMRTISPAARDAILSQAMRSEVVALGPGLSQHPETAALVKELVGGIPVALVLDADGLNCLGRDVTLLSGRTAPTIITPHPGELARLIGSTTDAIQQDRVDAARRAAQATGAIVILKGAATVTADPGGEAFINATGNPGMASGGMGDVLAGIVAAFVAGRATPISAAIAAVHYHGQAADLAAEAGQRGLCATDLLDALQQALPD